MTPPARPDSYVAFDLETTGLSPKTDRVLEIGAVRYDRQFHEVARLELLVDPGIPIPLAIQRLVGLQDADVAGAPSPAEGVAQLADFCEGAALITHGGAFDLHFTSSLIPDAFSNRTTLDTLDLARILLPMIESHGLPQLSAGLGLRHERPHRALSDADATGQLFARLAGAAAQLPVETLLEVRRVAAQVAGPLATFFGAVAGALPATAPMRTPVAEPSGQEPAPDAGFIQRLSTMRLDDAAAAALAQDGPLAQRRISYEYREEQVQMARAVAQALQRRRRLLVEAGTGVGKSLGYLVPLALWASRGGGRAVVSTQTVALQEQLCDSDLPAVTRLLPTPLATALLKGRSHYISLRRWARFLERPDVAGRETDLDAIRFKLKILVWLTQTRTGDRAELRLGATEESLWAWVASISDDCLGSLCANWTTRRCHMVASRARAADADIVVTNHSLLLADSERQGQVLAAYDALVVDEAHHLEAAATQQLGSSVRGVDLTRIVERLPAARDSAVGEALDRCGEAGQRLFGDVKGFIAEQLGGEHPGNGRVGLSPAMRDEPRFAVVLRSGRHAVGTLLSAAGALGGGNAGASMQAALLPQPERAGDELALNAIALTEIATAIDRVVCRPREGYVSWLELRGEQAELHEAPVSVAEPLREHVFDRVQSAILTSATLSVGGSFDFVRNRLGIGDGTEELALHSPFDYLSQALCVLPDGVPPYDDPIHDTVIAEMVGDLAERLGGRTLVLFTGYGPLRRVHGLLRDRLEARGIALLGQGLDGTRRQILRSFLDDARTVLLGTNSFWEGVDIPGERLRCVLIDKLPFAVPSDPLVRARTEGLRDPFAEYILPMAVIRLRQGFGRLIRGHADRGAVVLCDERLTSRDYGDIFLRALPPAPVARVSSGDVGALVERFVMSGAVPEAVGQSMRWSSNDSHTS